MNMKTADWTVFWIGLTFGLITGAIAGFGLAVSFLGLAL